jgi:hypothetical protein
MSVLLRLVLTWCWLITHCMKTSQIADDNDTDMYLTSVRTFCFAVLKYTFTVDTIFFTHSMLSYSKVSLHLCKSFRTKKPATQEPES